MLLCMCKMSGHEMAFIEEAFRDEWVVPLGPNVDGFEDDLQSYLGGRVKVLALSSGTAALHLSLILAGVKPGDEVMVQSLTFAASANPVKYLGANPVFVDSEELSWNMDPELLDFAIAERKRITGKLPAAIIVAELYGMPAQMDKMRRVASKWGIPLIEDAAEALGSEYNGERCSTLGDFGVLSFNGNKIITTSGGGALVTHNDVVRLEGLFLATQAREQKPYYQHETIGYNYRLSNISAGIGRGQMMVIGDHIRHHRHRQAFYRELFKDIEGVTLHENPDSRFDSNFWLSTITLDENVHIKGSEQLPQPEPGEPDADIEQLRRLMWEHRVETRPIWKPMHLQPVFSNAPAFTNGVSERIFRRGICLPAGPWVTDDDALKVVGIIKDNLRK